MVAGRAQRGGNPVQPLQKQHVVPHVGVVVGVGRVDQARIGGITRRTHAGRAAERIHFKAGIVGDDQFAGRKTRIVDGLGGGVGEEGVAVLFGSGNFARFRGADRISRCENACAAVRKSRSLPALVVAA